MEYTSTSITPIVTAALSENEYVIAKERKSTAPEGGQAVSRLFAVVLIVVGALGSESAFAESKPTIIKKQVDYEVMKESALQFLSPSGDPYDSFRKLSLKQISGIPIRVPIGPDGSGTYVNRGGARAIPVTFECDYSQGTTRGEAELHYQHPRNMYDFISGIIVVECLPLTEEERSQQLTEKEERIREASLKRAEEERSRQAKINLDALRQQEQANAEALRKEDETREAARKNSPQFKREFAEQQIKRMRAEIQAAEIRIAEERRVGNLSGYVDKRRLHELGSLIVAAEREIARNWAIYRDNGGIVRSVNLIR